MAKHPGGRPTKYKPEYCQAILDFFSGPKSERIVKSVTTGKNEYEKTEYETVPLELPTLRKFSRSIGVNKDTVIEWTKATEEDGKTLKYPEFSDAYNEIKDLQKEFLVDNGLAGLYPPASFIFTAKNITDMRDQSQVDHTSKGEQIKGFNYVAPNDSKHNADAKAASGVATAEG